MDEVLEWFEERAAIIAEGTGQGRGDAEWNAFACVVKWCQSNGKKLPKTQYFEARNRSVERIYFDDETGQAGLKPEENPYWK